MKKLLFLWLSLASVLGYSQGVQSVQVHRLAPPREVLYNASTVRDISKYPLTVSGLNSFTADASAGKFALSVLCPNGSTTVIPAGTRPPLTPPCSATSSSGPTWASARYSYAATSPTPTLSIQVSATQDIQVNFKKVSGLPFTTTNPDNFTVVSDNWYDPGSVGGTFSKQWQAYLAQDAYRVTFRLKNNPSQTYSVDFTPATGAQNVLLFSAGNNSPPGCDYSLAVNSPSVSCLSTVNLSASVSGTAATGLTYAWSGNGQTGTGLTKSFNAPGVNGQYTYTVTSNKSGCDPKTAQATVTVSGCTSSQVALAPPPGDTYNYPTVSGVAPWPQYITTKISGHDIGNTYVFENQYIRLEVRGDWGGSIQIYDKLNGNWGIINFNDLGRESELTIYGGPSNFSAGAPGNWQQIGWNPITPGDDGFHPSEIVAMGLVTGNDNVQRLYIKTHLKSWPHGKFDVPSIDTECWTERWIGLDGKMVDIPSRVTFDRSDLNYYEARRQEYPCMILSGWDVIHHYYNGSNPYTNASYTSTSELESPGVGFAKSDHSITEPWIASQYAKNGHWLFLNTDKLGSITTEVFLPQLPNETAESSNACSYSSPGNFLVVDPKGYWYHHYAWFLTADFNEGRAWANARPRKYGDTPNFTFDQAHGRNDWYVQSGRDNAEPFTGDGWRVTLVPTKDNGPDHTNDPLDARRGRISSPYVSHKASTITDLYLRMKTNTGQNTMLLQFMRNGQRDRGLDNDKPNEMGARYPNGAFNESTQKFTISGIISDGQYHTYHIQTASNSSEWKDVIVKYILRLPDGSALGSEQTFDILYFGKNDPGN